MVNLPNYAKRHTILMRKILQLHEIIANRLNSDSVDTLRASAWQIEEYLEEHGRYVDAEFIRTIQKSIEKVVQRTGGTKWTVEKAKRDLRGRTTGVNQFTRKTQRERAFAPRHLAQAIESKLTEPGGPTDSR